MSRKPGASPARLGISPPAASEAIAPLEEKPNVRLVVRATRSVGLAEEGEILLSSCRHVLAEMQSTASLLANRSGDPAGRLRLHSAPGFGRCVIVPLLAKFMRRWPLLTVDVDLSERKVNIHQEAFDLMICFGEPQDSLLVARKLGFMDFVTLASPRYLASRGEPRTPGNLGARTCMSYFLPLASRYRDWEHNGGHMRAAPSAHLAQQEYRRRTGHFGLAPTELACDRVR